MTDRASTTVMILLAAACLPAAAARETPGSAHLAIMANPAGKLVAR